MHVSYYKKYVNGNVGIDKGKERDEQQICGMQYRWQLAGKKQPEICAENFAFIYTHISIYIFFVTSHMHGLYYV